MKTQHFSFAELSIVPEDIEELMGFGSGTSPDPFAELIETGLKQAPEFCQIIGGYKIFRNVIIDSHAETIGINGQFFHPGKIVVSNLNKARQAALFLCTAGAGITEYSRRQSVEGNELFAYVLDLIGTVVVDKATNRLQEIILEEVSTTGFGITDSFSPGYCTWSVAEQKILFSLLPLGFCNITLSETSLMHPVKSISGITGIGIECERTGYQCDWCSDKNCINGIVRRRKKAKKYH